jgi:uncharacterized protein
MSRETFGARVAEGRSNLAARSRMAMDRRSRSLLRSVGAALAVLAPLVAATPAPAAASAAGASGAAASESTATTATAATAAAAATPPTHTMAASSPAADSYRQEIEKWRAERQAALKDPGGWLTVVGLAWLEEGENRFGSDPGNRVVLPAGTAPPVAGTLVRHGDRVTVHAQPGSGLTSGGHPVTEMSLISVADEKPVMMQLGSVSFFLIRRGDRLGVRVKDSQSAALAAFQGVESFPVDAGWRVIARFEPHPRPKSIPITNILGMTDNEPSPGVVVFEHGGKTYRLDALPGGGDGGLFLIFGDPTNGRETYGAGRFLDTDPPQGGKVVVDFNKAYNPPCAFTAYATCPLPPRQNRLAVAVTAGEKQYGEGHR